MVNELEMSDETGRWRARNVKYIRGRWDQLVEHVPVYKTDDFKAYANGPANPYLRSVVRIPKTLLEQAIPVAVVSNSYTLAQHKDVVEKCLEGLEAAGVTLHNLDCELGLTELGEWMNLRVYFPDEYSFIPDDGHKIQLRLECINSVDGSCRLTVLLSWLRIVCTNGMVIRETRKEISDLHNERLNLSRIPEVVVTAMSVVQKNIQVLSGWEDIEVDESMIKGWADRQLAEKWGKKAACRTFHICTSGKDIEFTDPFAAGKPSEKPVTFVADVPGQPHRATNAYEVSQALSWVASSRTNPEERLDWQ